MIEIKTSYSLTEPELQPYLTMRKTTEHSAQRIFVAEGEKVTRRLLASPFTVISLLVTAEWFERIRPEIEARSEPITVYITETKRMIEEMTGFSFYQGILGVGRMPEPVPLEQILMTSPEPYLFLALDSIAQAENVGVIIRNAAALGAHAVITAETSCGPFIRRAIRSSMGTVFKLHTYESPNLATTLGYLKKQGFKIVAAHPSASGNSLDDEDLTTNVCVVLGSEGHGIRPEVLEIADSHTAIPMSLGVDSLNVAAASAIFLYEVVRQRNWA